MTGKMTGGTGEGAHMWNVIDLDGSTYLCDITNSDEGTVGQDGGLFMVSNQGDADSYIFNVGNTSIAYTYDDDKKNITVKTSVFWLSNTR